MWPRIHRWKASDAHLLQCPFPPCTHVRHDPQTQAWQIVLPYAHAKDYGCWRHLKALATAHQIRQPWIVV